MTFRLSALFVALAVSACAGCGPQGAKEAAESPPPAKVAKPADENQLATIILTPQAEERLGIPLGLGRVERKPMRRNRTIGGEVVFPPGQAITVSAPQSGTLAAVDGGNLPVPGSQVQKGRPIFSLLPLLAPEHTVLSPSQQAQLAESRVSLATAQIEAEQRLQSAEVEVEAAGIELARAQQLVRDKAGTQQTVDQARATLQLAEKSFEAAQAQYQFLQKARLEAEAGSLVVQIIVAPVTGVLSNFAAVPGETVVAGSALFEVVNTERMWIRVPIYVGQWREVDTAPAAVVKEFGEPPQAPGRPARPIVAPPSANPIAATVDLFYEVDNYNGELRPGQKVAVTLPLKGQEESLVVPKAAVLFDIHGGSWVYAKVGPQTFLRRRVEVQYVSGPLAVMSQGPGPGTEVVTDGAAELFGTEFGFGK